MPELMQCGHTANSTYQDQPVCAICFTAGGRVSTAMKALTVAEKTSLNLRRARCSYGQQGFCKNIKNITEVDSDYDLAFFKYDPEKEFDTYYCGCFGWD